MRIGTTSLPGAGLWAIIYLQAASATSVPRLSFNELTDRSEIVVTGHVNRTWADWDAEHKYIWTHYEFGIAGTLKGAAGGSVVLSEPGGVVGIEGMVIAGSVAYHAGEEVLVFLQRMPNGYLRTTGWSQGKFTVDKTDRLHAAGPPGGLELVDQKNSAAAMRSPDGMRVTELRGLIAARVRAQGKTR
jgi:hypothetical protein